MLNIHEQLSQIKIKNKKITPEALRKVYKYAAENKPKRALSFKVKRFAWVGAVATAMVIALVLFVLPQTSRDFTLANIGYYTIDINPSVSVKTDASKNVIGIEALNEDGEKLLDSIDCDGKPINEALQIILDAARQMGYLEGRNVVIGYFGSGNSGVSMDKVEELAGLGKAVLLVGTKNQYEGFVKDGLQPGLELLELEGEKLGLKDDSPFSDIVAALIKSSQPATEKPSAIPVPSPSFTPEITEEPTEEPTPEKTPTPKPTEKETTEKTPTTRPTQTSENLASTISGEVTDNGIRLNWTKITNASFNGYKVVASKTNPHPKYPDDGYLYYITNSSTTTVLIPFSSLHADTNYYFSITALYDGGKVSGNAIMLKTPEQEILYESTTLSGVANSTGIVLEWNAVDVPGAQGYKVVASIGDSTPSYPENGYIEYITNLFDTRREYNNPHGTLQAGQSYWFAITILYSDGTKITSNAINLTMPAIPTPTPSPSPSFTPTPTPTESESATPSPTESESATPSPTESETASPT